MGRGAGFACRRDEAGNRVIAVPASPGCEGAPTVVLQAHVDMVCEKNPGTAHDFTNDPIKPLRRDGWLVAEGTTLGADNGIAVAIMMALAEDEAVKHGPLELLLTVEEETGLVGAGKLDPALVSGRLLLNLDSETEGELTIGCAGGMTVEMSVPLAREEMPEGWGRYMVRVDGLRGGHSGVDIHLGRLNAIKVLAGLISDFQYDIELRVHEVRGGAADNAIPRVAEAIISFEEDQEAVAQAQLYDLVNTLVAAHGSVDPEMRVNLDATDEGAGPLTDEDTTRVLALINGLPHGSDAMEDEAAKLVRTSSNLASVSTGETAMRLVSSQRSLYTAERDAMAERIEKMARSHGATEAKFTRSYPAWEPKPDSALAARFKEVYRKLRGEEPAVRVIHAGLECAVIGQRIGGMDMISFGPTIQDPHSPSERAEIASVGRTYELTAAVVGELIR